jgi:tetratricopeptide (TPR) repeat protein
MQNGKLEEAIEYFNRAIAIRPDWGILHVNASMAAARSGNLESALQHIEQASASNDGSVSPPALSRGYFVIAGEYEKRGDRSSSIQTLTKAVQIDPNFIEAAKLLDKMKAASGQ